MSMFKRQITRRFWKRCLALYLGLFLILPILVGAIGFQPVNAVSAEDLERANRSADQRSAFDRELTKKHIKTFRTDIQRASTKEEVRRALGTNVNTWEDDVAYKNFLDGANWIGPTKTWETQGGFQDWLHQKNASGKTNNSYFDNSSKYVTYIYRKGVTEDDYVHSNKGDFYRMRLTSALLLDKGMLEEIADEGKDIAAAKTVVGCVTGGPLGCMTGFLTGGALGGLFGAIEAKIQGSQKYGIFLFTSDINPHIQSYHTCISDGGKVDPADNRNLTVGGSVMGFFSGRKSEGGEDEPSTQPQENNDEGQFSAVGTSKKFGIARRTMTVSGNEAQSPSTVQGPEGGVTRNPDFREVLGGGGGNDGREWFKSGLPRYLCNKAENKEGFKEWCVPKLKEGNCIYDRETLAEVIGVPSPIKWALNILKAGVGFLLGLAKSAAVDASQIGNLTGYEGLVESWQTIRDLVNLLFVLILCVVAFSNILRFDTEKYGIRALLPRLVFAVIAVNFSLIMATIIVDAAQVLGAPFAHSVQMVTDNLPIDENDANIGDVGQALIMLFLALILAIVLLILALMYLVRFVMIVLLAALSPVAFLFMVLPLSRGLARMWFSNMMKWAFMAPISFIILFIGGNFITAADSFGNVLLGLGVFVIMIIAAVMIPIQLGGRVMAMASKPGGKLGGMIGRGLLNRTGIPAALQQGRESAAHRNAERGARLRGGVGDAIQGIPGLRAKGSRMGAEGGMTQTELQEKEAARYANTLNDQELQDLKESAKGTALRGTIELAMRIRGGQYEMQKQADKAKNVVGNMIGDPERGAKGMDEAMIDQQIGGLDAKGAKRFFNPATFAEVASAANGYIRNKDGEYEKLQNPDDDRIKKAKHILGNLSTDAVAGLQEQGHPVYTHALAAAQANGHLSTAVQKGFQGSGALDDKNVDLKAANTHVAGGRYKVAGYALPAEHEYHSGRATLHGTSEHDAGPRPAGPDGGGGGGYGDRH